MTGIPVGVYIVSIIPIIEKPIYTILHKLVYRITHLSTLCHQTIIHIYEM